jgi:hypothetical protein
MISHDRAQELISARMDAPLTAAEHHELQRHLAACDSCRYFISQANDVAQGLQVLPRLAPSPAVSRAVMDAVWADTPAWGWLRRSLQTLSSPGIAVASGLALVVALAGALIITMNAPDRSSNLGAEPEGTIAAVAAVPLPTEVPTEIPTTEPEPTATRTPLRTVAPAPTKEVARTPTPQPTATRVVMVAAAEPTTEPVIEPAIIEEPIIQPVAEDPTLAMAEEPVDTGSSAELAQAAEPLPSDEGVNGTDAAPALDEEVSEADTAPAIVDSGTSQEGPNESVQAPVAEPVATSAVPDEAIAALESAATTTDINLPPAPPLPMPPSQAFLPITPTPISDGTPTPEPETQAEAPQLAEDWSDDSGVTALIPEAPQVTDGAVADVTITETDTVESGTKRDRSEKDGKSHESKQAAYSDDAMGWSLAPVDLGQSPELFQTADATTGSTAETAASEPATTENVAAEPGTATESVPQYDPATGLEIDPATGLLIDPVTGYLLDRVNGRIIDPRTGYLVHPMTGLLIDPATGAQLDPVTLAIVIPAGFGSDTPEYVPGSDSMRGTIEGVVDDTYDNATYQVIPPTDGPAQPVGEIVVPTESGEAHEIS